MRKGSNLLWIIIPLAVLSGFYDPGKQQDAACWKVPAWTDTLKNPFAGDEKAISEGRKLYESACWTCHGKTGLGDGPAAKGCKPKPADHTCQAIQSQSDGALYWKITKGKGQMSPYEKVYSKAQRWKLVSFIRSLEKKESK